MSNIKEYFSSVGQGIKSLVKGMQVTGKELVIPRTVIHFRFQTVFVPS